MLQENVREALEQAYPDGFIILYRKKNTVIDLDGWLGKHDTLFRCIFQNLQCWLLFIRSLNDGGPDEVPQWQQQ